MNDKDKEEFDKWFLEAYRYDYHKLVIPESVNPQKEAWQAACEYKDKEIDDIYVGWQLALDYVNNSKDEIFKLEAENKKLREALEFYADYQNWKFSDKYACIIWMDHDNYPSHINGRKINGYESLFVSGKIAREALKEVNDNQ